MPDIFPAALTIPCASREEWLARRREGIGASDAPALVGWDRGKRFTPAAWRGPLEIYADKISAGRDNETEAMRWGHRFEAPVRAEFAARHPDWKIEAPGMTIFRCRAHPFLQATLDGIILAGPETGILEIKTSRVEWMEVPVHYQIQVQAQLLVTGAPWGIVAALFGGSKYQEFPRIDVDPEWAEFIIRDCSTFWDRVQRRDPPLEILAPKNGG